MGPRGTTLLAVAAGLLAPAPAPAADAGFAATVVAGSASVSGPVSAGVADTGAAVATGTSLVVRGRMATQRVVVVTRHGAGGAWREQRFGVGLLLVRDAQALVTPHGTAVLAWAQVSAHQRHAVAVAAGPAGGRLRVIADLPVGNAMRAQPRLALLRDGRTLLAYRAARAGHPTRLRVAPVGGDRVGRGHDVARGVGTIAFTGAGDHAAAVWMAPYAEGAPAARALHAVRVRGDATAVGRALRITATASGTPRVGASDLGHVLVAWTAPATATGPARAWTRRLWPRPGPRRSVPLPPGLTLIREGALVDVAADGSAVAALRATGAALPFGQRILVSAVPTDGPWPVASAASLTAAWLTPARPVALGGAASLVVFAGAREVLGPPGSDVLVALRDADGSIAGAQVLPYVLDIAAGTGIAVAARDHRQLIAYGAATGGIAVSERTG